MDINVIQTAVSRSGLTVLGGFHGNGLGEDLGEPATVVLVGNAGPARLLGTAPSAGLHRAAADALGTAPAEVLWVSVPLDPAAYGLLSLRVWIGALNVRVPVLVAPAAGQLHLIPHRGRLAYAQRERAVFHVIAARGYAGGPATVKVKVKAAAGAETETRSAGTITLPPVTGRAFDSRSFVLALRELPRGNYDLWVEHNEVKSGKLPINVVAFAARSPFFAHTMSCCTGNWPQVGN